MTDAAAAQDPEPELRRLVQLERDKTAMLLAVIVPTCPFADDLRAKIAVYDAALAA